MALDGARGRDWADDGELADEITMYGDLVVAASESEHALTVAEIDAALGVRPKRTPPQATSPRLAAPRSE